MEISNKRCIQILKLLLKNKECMTGDNLAVAIGVSSRTIRNDMKDLNRAFIGRSWCKRCIRDWTRILFKD